MSTVGLHNITKSFTRDEGLNAGIILNNSKPGRIIHYYKWLEGFYIIDDGIRTIYTRSKPPFNLKDISNPFVSHSGTWCLTIEDLKYFEGLAHRPISDKKSDIINKDRDADRDFKYKDEIIGDSAVSTDRDIDADRDFKYKGEIIGDSAVSTDRDVIDSKTL